MMLDDDLKARLIDVARDAATRAYAPYSNFAVGAAVLLTDGTIVAGANFENASYGLSLCAETVALATTSSAGHLADVVAIAVIGGVVSDGRVTGIEPISPCGRCRQVINEAAQMGHRDVEIFCGSAEGDLVTRYLCSDLLPHAFGPADLGVA
jgi:cytidine deaminase